MDFGVLSKYDDLLATYFLDSFYLWFSTVRMNMDFTAPKIDTAPSIAIIRDQIVKQRDPSKAALEFLKMPYFQEYLQDKTDKRKLEFTQHLKRYMLMFMPNAGFEIDSTERYTGKMEACIRATRDWEAGEQVTCCQGAIAELNSEEDAKLKKEGRDFSVMVSTRKKCTCLFLGPARFMNHDCDANCEFILLNQNAITFRIKRNIAEGDEMTVFYGEHYFGEDNCECLCASCEKGKEGKFSPTEDNASPNEDNTSGNSNNTSGGTSPTPSLSSSSSSRDRGSKSTKNDKNPRRSSRKRKDISYTDYFEPLEPKKARRGRSAKELEPDYVFEETIPSKRDMLLDKKDAVVKSNGYKDTENIDPSQPSCTQKKLEPARQNEMSLSFICEHIETFEEKYDKWLYITTYPSYDPAPMLQQANIENKPYWSELKSLEHNCIPGEAVLVPVPPLFSIRPYIIGNTPQSMYEDSFQLDFDGDDTAHNEMKRNRRKSHEYQVKFNNWTDELSACSDEEKIVPCCSKYDEKTANSETHMCARCHRHYCIYGIDWPVRKIRKAPGKKRAPKKTPKQQRQALNSIVFAPTYDPSLSSSSFSHISSSSPSLPPPRHILEKPESIPASAPFPLPPSVPIAITPSSYYRPPPLRVPPVPSLPPVPEPQLLLHSPTSPSPISSSSSQQQILFSNSLDTTTMDRFDQFRISSLPSNSAILPMLGGCLNEATDSLSEELDKKDMSSCSRQFNSLMPHVSVDLLRD